MNCPVCKDTVLMMTEKKGIEVDYCPSCRGVWLDRGELDQLIQPPGSPRGEFHSQRVPEHYENHARLLENSYSKYKKKKSLLQELFD